MDKNKILKYKELVENAYNGDEAEMKALKDQCKADKITVEEAEEIAKYSLADVAPETAVEQRRERKGKAADENRSADAIPVEKIAKAYGVDLKQAEEDGELVGGGLQKYLKDRAVMSKLPNEDREGYVNRNRNAFEELGLNWDNVKDRGIVANSIGLASLQDVRQDIADEMNGGLTGLLRNIVYPRTMEHYTRDVLNGEETEGYGKDKALDVMENGLQILATPVSGPAGALAKYVRGAKAFKNFKKGKAILDGRTKVNKAAKGLETLVGIGADAAAVPFTMEALDAVSYDDPENARSEFNANDAVVGTLVNAVTPGYVRMKTQRGFGRVAGDEAGKAAKAMDDIDNYANLSRLKAYVAPYVTNKMGKGENIRVVPVLGPALYEKSHKEEIKNEKKQKAARTKHEKWQMGFSIPMPGDRDFEEYQAWKNQNLARILGL